MIMMIKCPECKKIKVSDTATSCPNCGFNVAKYMETYKPPTMEDVKREASNVLKMLIICIILVVILYFMVK